MQTEMHHIRTLRIMSEVYSKGLQNDVQLEQHVLERLFPALEELLDLHTQHLQCLLERKKQSQLEGGSLEGGVVINRIGDILVSQVSTGREVLLVLIHLKMFFRQWVADTFPSRGNLSLLLLYSLELKEFQFK